jgi:flagellar biosynthesis chaperone FliJ
VANSNAGGGRPDQVLTAAITDYQQQIQVIDLQIAQKQRELAKLEDDRDALETKMQSYQAARSKITAP